MKIDKFMCFKLTVVIQSNHLLFNHIRNSINISILRDCQLAINFLYICTFMLRSSVVQIIKLKK
jgi:hypothetical protein